jgi:hypothetical protein
MIVRGKPFLIKFPVGAENSIYLHALANATVNAKVCYKLYHKPVHKTSPQRRGRKRKYANRSKANHAYYERRKSRLAQTVA